MRSGTTVGYAVERTKKHILSFTELYDEIKSGAVDEARLSEIEGKDNIFPDIDYAVYRN